MKRTDLAYIAGIVDADGWIGLNRDTSRGYRYYRARVTVTNKEKWLVEWFKFSFGGSIYKSHKRSKETQEDCWRWIAQCKLAHDFLKLILPYLKLKRAQAELAIKFQEKLSKKRKSDEVKAVEEAEKLLMDNLHRKEV